VTEPSTGLAVDGEETVWVAWEDVDGVHLASNGDQGGEFKEQELSQTDGGVTPSVAVAEDGSSVYLAWFDPEEADLRVGVSADLGELVMAAPSPTPPPTSTGGAAGCGDDNEPILDIVASGTAFDKSCLVAPAGQPFTIDFDNEDPQPHNISIYSDSGYTTPVETTPLDGAPVSEKVGFDFKPIDQPGTLYFQCDFHPIPAMRGTFAVVAVGGGGGGGQGGGGGNGGGGGG
jgi:plastocyanin